MCPTYAVGGIVANVYYDLWYLDEACTGGKTGAQISPRRVVVLLGIFSHFTVS